MGEETRVGIFLVDGLAFTWFEGFWSGMRNVLIGGCIWESWLREGCGSGKDTLIGDRLGMCWYCILGMGSLLLSKK